MRHCVTVHVATYRCVLRHNINVVIARLLMSLRESIMIMMGFERKKKGLLRANIE